jgi:hypothetical protein
VTRIVTTHYRYKPPPKKRKAVALEVPAVVTAKRSRHPPRGKQAAAEVTGCPNPGAAPPEHIAAINDYEKPVIVTSISRKQQKHLSAGWSAAA